MVQRFAWLDENIEMFVHDKRGDKMRNMSSVWMLAADTGDA
jgi:hypothetical protein